MDFLIFFIASALSILATTMAMNLLIFPKLTVEKPHDNAPPSVSILIPARNESKVIEGTIKYLLQQTYSNFELIILDDKSDDNTGEIARKAEQNDARLRVILGTDLPNGWTGKNWACHKLAQVAEGDILIFTDADVQWKSTQALNSLITQMNEAKVDMLTVWSTQITQTYAERLTVPLMGMVILGYLPTAMVHYSPFSIFSAANGQVMAWRQATYEAIGGHQSVANNVLDDVTLARLAKKSGYKIRMVDGNEQIQARMYENWQSVRDGYAKNILAGYGSVAGLVLGTIFHWLIFLVPYLLLFLPDYRLTALVLIIAGLTLRTISASFTKQRVLDALLMPVTVILFTIIAIQSIYWHITGKSSWKGRTL